MFCIQSRVERQRTADGRKLIITHKKPPNRFMNCEKSIRISFIPHDKYFQSMFADRRIQDNAKAPSIEADV